MSSGLARSAAALLAGPLLAWAAAGAPAEQITRYEVTLVGAADGTLDVAERIDYDFDDVQRHGIFRDIPNTVPAPLGGRRTLKFGRIRIEQDGREAQWAQESVFGDAGSMLRLRVGDPGLTISGRHTYTLRYEVADALLPSGGKDAFRWNAIGTGWSVPIQSAKIRLTLPVELRNHPGLESSFFTGPWGATERNGSADWNPRDGVYQVTAGPLRPHEGITVEVSFPPGSIAATAHPSPAKALWQALPQLWAWPVMLIGLGLAWRHWNRVGRDPPSGPVVVSYRPPEGLEAAEAGLLIDQSLNHSDLAGTVIELAGDGWIRVGHPESDGMIQRMLGRSRVTLERLRPREEWPGLPPYKQYLLESFFCAGDRFSPGGEEEASVVRRRNHWLEKAKARVHERGVEHGLFPGNPRKVRTAYMVGAAILAILLVGLALWRSNLPHEPPFLAVASLFFIAIAASVALGAFRRGKGVLLRALLPAAVGVAILGQILPLSPSLPQSAFPGWGSVLFDPLAPMAALALGLLLFAWQMPQRTLRGARVQGELLGFREFVKRADEPRLRMLLQQDSAYFERTLPYAAVFGLVAEWARRFEGLAALPVWYEGGGFDHLGRDLNRLSSSGVASSPPSKSGGGSGGGGFSGGGGGGGGGGSW